MWLFRADVDRSWLCAVGVARRGLSAGWLALSLVVAAAMVPTAAAADDVDIAVDAFAAGGAVLGASPGPEVKDLVKAIVRCAIAKTPIQVCARGEVIKRLPEELQNLATCTAKEGAIEKCAAGEALSRMPPQARDLISCVGTQPNLGQCASRGVVNAASKSAMEMVDKLQADGRSELGAAAPGQIRNIINVAEGIRDDDWPKVSLYGGAEIYKLVAKTVLRIVIPAGSALAPVIDPVVDAMVQSRVDLVVGLIEAVKKGDEPKISSLIVEFYLIAHVEIPCALFNVIPGGSARDAIKDAICGTIGDAIKVIGGLSSDVTRTAESVARDALGAVGIDARGILGGDCGTTASFYASRYSVCLKQSAFLNLTNTGGADAFTNSLNASCRTTFEPCSRRIGGGTSDRISDQCNPLRDQFVKQTAALAGGIRAMAASYVRAHLADLLRASPGGVCSATSAGGIVADCANALGAQSPGLNRGNWSRCGDADLPRPDLFGGACLAEACKAVTPRAAACLQYADSAIGTLKLAKDAKCAATTIGGSRWDPDLNNHLQFCLGASPQASNFENQERVRIYGECRLAALLPHNITTLAVGLIENDGGFKLDGTGFAANARVVIDISGREGLRTSIPGQFSDSAGRISVTLPRSTVCTRPGPVMFVGRDGDNPPSKPVEAVCTRSCTSAACLTPPPALSVTDPRGQASIALKGTGLSPNATVTISFSSSASHLPQPPPQTTDASGNFELSVQSNEVCQKPGRLNIEVTEQGKPPLSRSIDCPAESSSAGSGQAGCSANANACADGYVWRKAVDNDLVCVTPAAAWLTRRENSVASVHQRRVVGPIARMNRGPPVFKCVDGSVLRNAFDGDTVCVTPEEAARIKRENEEAKQHLACPM